MNSGSDVTPKEYQKVLKKLVSEGYKLKAQHNNPEWKKVLEDAEELMIKAKNDKNEKI